MICEKNSYSNIIGLIPDKNDKLLTIMYWTAKLDKDSIGTCFIVAFKKYFKKQFLKQYRKPLNYLSLNSKFL